MAARHIGTCEKCGIDVYHDDDNPVSEESNVGDWNFVCYPCQFEMMDNGTWQEWRDDRRVEHGERTR